MLYLIWQRVQTIQSIWKLFYLHSNEIYSNALCRSTLVLVNCQLFISWLPLDYYFSLPSMVHITEHRTFGEQNFWEFLFFHWPFESCYSSLSLWSGNPAIRHWTAEAWISDRIWIRHMGFGLQPVGSEWILVFHFVSFLFKFLFLQTRIYINGTWIIAGWEGRGREWILVFSLPTKKQQDQHLQNSNTINMTNTFEEATRRSNTTNTHEEATRPTPSKKQQDQPFKEATRPTPSKKQED